MDTLQPPFFEKMIGSVLYGFSDMVTIGEMIEQGMKSIKIPHTTGASSGVRKFSWNSQKKKEGETNVIMVGGGKPYHSEKTPARHPQLASSLQPHPVHANLQFENQNKN